MRSTVEIDNLSWQDIWDRDAEIARLKNVADNRICWCCLQRHPIECICPPHEVRTTGQEWFRERLREKDAEIERLKGELQGLRLEIAEMSNARTSDN